MVDQPMTIPATVNVTITLLQISITTTFIVIPGQQIHMMHSKFASYSTGMNKIMNCTEYRPEQEKDKKQKQTN